MISVDNISKSYGARNLFEGLTFQLGRRERIGLVGRNGHGKTTLFRIVAGQASPDHGSVVVPKNYRIGYLLQEPDFHADTILEEAAGSLPEIERDQTWKAEKILAGLGFGPDDMSRPPSEFSGGYQVRLNLAKVLLSEPDLLLLDEPTNFLDITSIRWVVRFLAQWPREVMLITHDRSFMDQVVTHTMGIHRLRLRKVKGDTGKYYDQIAQEEEVHEKTRLNEEKRRRDMEQFITRFRAKARLAGMVQSRIKTLNKMETGAKLESIATLGFSFRSCAFPTKQMLRVDGLRFGYDPAQPLIDGLSFHLSAGECICIVGPNGKGKTTLLKLLAEQLSADSGTLAYNPNVKKGYYEQSHVASLTPMRSVEEEILFAAPDVERQTARNICGAMMFSGDDALKPIRVLSGGEKSRVLLGKLLVTPLNLLLLDEPSNHLDMESCDALVTAIEQFEGSVIMVTHNEMFLHALADRLIVFRPEGLEMFEGTYGDFLQRGGWENEEASTAAPAAAESVPEKTPLSGKERKKRKQQRSALIHQRARKMRPLQKQMQVIETEIEQKEALQGQCNQDLVAVSQSGERERIAALSKAAHEYQQKIDALYEQLEQVSEKIDRIQAEFAPQLTALDDG